MSTIATIDTTNLPQRVVAKSKRVGKVVSEMQISDIGVMVELAFDNQLYTECFWGTELINA